jgi:hypothetical protein
VRRACALWLLPALAGAEPARVALAPVASLTEARAPAVEALVERAIAAVPDRVAVGADRVRELLRRAGRRDLESCEGAPPCLAELGRIAGAPVVVYAEAGALAGDRVVYLKAVEAARREELGSTTVVLRKGAEAAAAREGVIQLLAPAAHVGTLALHVDVPGATVFVDGRVAGRAPLAPLAVPVGTHALRVTHPRYRDFVRFVDVRFEERNDLRVELERFAVVGDSLVARRPPGGPAAPWILAGAGAALLVTAAVIAFLVPPRVERDRDVVVGGE